MVKADVEESAKHLQSAQAGVAAAETAVGDAEKAAADANAAVEAASAQVTAALTMAEDDLADKKEELTKAKARAAATLHALNLAKARLAALEATQPNSNGTDEAYRTNDRAACRTFY